MHSVTNSHTLDFFFFISKVFTEFTMSVLDVVSSYHLCIIMLWLLLSKPVQGPLSLCVFHHLVCISLTSHVFLWWLWWQIFYKVLETFLMIWFSWKPKWCLVNTKFPEKIIHQWGEKREKREESWMKSPAAERSWQLQSRTPHRFP